MRAAIEWNYAVGVVIVVRDQHRARELLNLEGALVIDARYPFLESAADWIEVFDLGRLPMLLVEERRILGRPRLVWDLPVNGVDDWTTDHRPLAADRRVLGALELRILD